MTFSIIATDGNAWGVAVASIDIHHLVFARAADARMLPFTEELDPVVHAVLREKIAEASR